MALEVVNGYPVLSYDLGKGPQRLTNSKYVATGDWYQAIIDRTPNDIKLIIREELDNGTVVEHVNETPLEPTQNVFNVDRNSRLFVGASPEDYILPEDITSPPFEGDIEDLRVGDEQVGLFNFVHGEDNNHGAVARDKLISDELPPTGYRFNGNGYIAMKATPYNFRTRSSIQFRFKADKDTKDGLLFFYGRNHHFMSIELVNGGVYFRFKLGEQHLVSSGTIDQYNDNEWHRVVAERDGRRGLLKVDDMLVFQKEAAAEADESMHNFKIMYFGGAPGERNLSFIVQQNFEGCIDDVTIAGTKVDLGQHISAEGVRPGCPPKFSNTLSFAPYQHGYLRSANINANNDFHIELTFRTRQPEGVIFYATNYNQSAAIGLTLQDGYLILRNLDKLTTSNKDGQSNELIYEAQRLDDGVDHAVSVQHTANELRLTVDNFDHVELPDSPAPLLIYAGDIFFGGLPPKYNAPDSSLSTHAYFVGCISDVKYRGEIINFAESPEKMHGNTHSTGCPANLLAYDPTTVPIYFADGSFNSFSRGDSRGPPLAPFGYDEATTTPEPTTTTTTTTLSPYINMINKTDSEFNADPDLLTASVTTTKKPETPECALPTNPNFDVSFDEAGYRFAVIKDQRLELIPDKRMKKHFDISFSLRTANGTGLLYYAADNLHRHNVTLYLEDGYVHYVVEIDSIRAHITSAVQINDMAWHLLQFGRNNRKLSLIIDNVDQPESVTLNEQQQNVPMAVDFPVYVGGVPKALENDLKELIYEENSNNILTGKETDNTFPYFNGCIRDIKLSGQPKKPIAYNVVPCSEQTEYGLFFQKPNSFVKLVDSFNVGVDVSISFDFKPRDPNGLLFSVHGKHAFMILELVDNRLVFTVKSDARNRVQTNYTLPDDGNFCDGTWRNVQAVKSRYVITIAVQYIGAQPGIGPPGTTNTKTNRPLFLGGHQLIHKVPGLQTRKGFKGCIRNLQINKNNVQISNEQIYGEVWRGVCPLN